MVFGGALLVLAGLLWARDDDPVIGGPLFAGVDESGGGSYVDWPRGDFTHVRATFGSYVLCLQHGDHPAVLRRVRPINQASADFTPYLRTVTPDAVAAAGRRQQARYIPLGFGLGGPPRWDEPYASSPTPGNYADSIRGTRITQPCKSTDAATYAINRRQVPEVPFTELMIVIAAGISGAEVNGVYVDYEVDGKEYSRKVAWDMVVCDPHNDRPDCGEPD